MEDQIKIFKDNQDFLKLIEGLLKNQVKLDIQIDALKYIFQAILCKMDPSIPLEVHNKAYLAMIQKIGELKLEENIVFSEEMTEMIRSELKDVPGLILPSLK